MNSPVKEYIYVLELNNDKYYVGKTKDIAKRFNDHKSQKGSAWTKLHSLQGCKIIEIYECTSLFDEDKYTLEYMNKIGVDNVRGGSYSNCILTIEQLNNITRALRNANNLCMTCGESDHYSDMCSMHKNDTFRSDSNNVNYDMDEELNSMKPISSAHINDHESLRFPHVRYLSPTGVVHDNTEGGHEFVVNSCGRCGRNSHTTTKCYAKTDVYGKVL